MVRDPRLRPYSWRSTSESAQTGVGAPFIETFADHLSADAKRLIEDEETGSRCRRCELGRAPRLAGHSKDQMQARPETRRLRMLESPSGC